jgi:hypothetical protein
MEASRDSYRRKERKMIQFDFFSKPFGTHPKKLVRHDDPDTSHASAKKVDSSKLEGMVYDAIRFFGDRVASAMRYGSTLHTCLIQASRLVIKLSLIKGSLRIPVSAGQAPQAALSVS